MHALRPELVVEPDQRSSRARVDVLLVVSNSRPFAVAVGLATGFGTLAVLPPPTASVADVLEALRECTLPEAALILVDGALRLADLAPPPVGGGVELLQHLRLTPSLGGIALHPAAVALEGGLESALRANPANAFVCSPASYAVPGPPKLSALLRILAEAEGWESEEALRAGLGSHVVFSQADEASRDHDYRNRAGAFRLAREFAGRALAADTSLLAAERRQALGALWLKKREFLESSGTESDLDFSSGQLTVIGRGKKFLLIDDEHANGWCLGLFLGLFGRLPTDEELHPKEPVAVPIQCIESETAAESHLVRLEAEWASWLDRWCAAESASRRADVELAEATRRQQEAGPSLRQAESNASSAQQRLEAVRKRCEQEARSYLSQLQEVGESLAEIVTSSDAVLSVDDSRINESLKGLAARQGHYLAGREALAEERRKHDGALGELERARARQHESSQALATAMAAQQRAARELMHLEAQRQCVMPFDLAFLDLRLDHQSASQAGELGGIRVLRRLKQLDPSLPVIVFSASNAIASYRAAIGAGADGYWVKGVSTPMELATLIETLLATQGSRRLWFDIRRLEKRSRLYRISFRGGAPEAEEVPEGEREMLLEWLKIACSFLHGSGPGIGAADPTDSSPGEIIRYLALVQELRYAGLREERWDQKTKVLPREDVELRRRRNQLSHAGGAGTRVPFKEASDALRFTVQWLLSDRALQLVGQLSAAR